MGGERIRAFGKWLATGFIPGVTLTIIAFALGYSRGHEAGRLEMKCAIFAVVERLGEVEPAPGTITLGCEKVPASRTVKTEPA